MVVDSGFKIQDPSNLKHETWKMKPMVLDSRFKQPETWNMKLETFNNMGEELNKKIVTATKWSSVTEIAAKLVAPVTTMLLARILTPDAFGVLVTVMMVISFE